MKNTSLQPKIVVLKIIWTALFLSQFVYLFVLHFVLRPIEGDLPMNTEWVPNFQNPIEVIFFFLSLGLLILSFLIPPKIARNAFQNLTSTPSSEDSENVRPELFLGFIVRMALIEAICLQGFALAMMKHSPNQILPFFAVCFILNLKYFPSSVEKLRDDLNV